MTNRSQEPLQVRVYWRPQYDITYSASSEPTEPFSLNTFLAATGGVGEHWYGQVSVAPTVVGLVEQSGDIARDTFKRATEHKAESLWEDLQAEVFQSEDQKKKFVKTMSRGLWIASTLRNQGTA
jgi:hypothetical protein